MREFVTEARAVEEGDDTGKTTFKHDGREVTFYEPSAGQQAMMVMLGRRDSDMKMAGQFIALFFELMDEETQRYFENRLMDHQDTFDLASPGGIFDIWEGLVEEWSGKAGKQPTDYQPPQRATGQSSTARTPARRASTSSRSRTAGS